MSNWEITLAGDERELQFAESLLADSHLAISTRQGEHVLVLPNIPPTAEKEAAYAAAQNCIENINGALRLLRIGFRGVSISTVLKTDESGGRVGYIRLQDVHVAPQGFELQPSDRILVDLIRLAEDDSEVARAFYLFGSLKPNWKNLYMVYDVIEQDFAGESGLMAAKLTDNEQLKLFKRTANSYATLGRDARHAKNRETPPDSPMSLENAQQFVTALLKVWIEHRKSA